MRFSFSRPGGAPTPKVDPVRQEMSRLGSEAAVIAAACSSIADAHARQLQLIDAAVASATELAQSFRSAATQEAPESGGRSLSRLVEPVRQMTSSSTRVAQAVGELAQTTLVLSSEADASGNAVAEVATAVEEISRSAAAAVRQAEDGAREMDRASQSVAGLVASTQQLAASADGNVAAVGKLTAATGEVSRATNDVAQRAARAATSVDEAARGAAAVERSIGTVVQLAHEHREAAPGPVTADITVVVEAVTTIAERINLLSLNAAIEAAHAGDAGRGFVVIAEELRNLSERAAKAADETKSLIQGLQSAVRDTLAGGDRLATAAEDAAASGRRIAESVASAAAEVREMSAGAAGHAAMLQEVAQGAMQAREASEALVRATANHAQSARETLGTTHHAITVAGEARVTVAAQSGAISELARVSDIARRSAASTARRLKEQASSAARASTEVEAVARASTDLEAALTTAAHEAAKDAERSGATLEARAAAAEAVARTLTELRGLAERTARSASDNSTVSAALQQRVRALGERPA